jgi:hypothetical protein
MTRAVAAIHLLLVLTLLLAAAGLWRLRCEGFGCMGIGVAWIAWAVAFIPVLGLGAWAQRKAAAAPGLAMACRAAGWLQLVTGVALLMAWLVKRWG